MVVDLINSAQGGHKDVTNTFAWQATPAGIVEVDKSGLRPAAEGGAGQGSDDPG